MTLKHTSNLRSISNRTFDSIYSDFIDIANNFDMEKSCNEKFIPEELVFFYGEPVYQDMSEKDKLKLNHLTWCAIYYRVLLAECGVSVVSTSYGFQKLKLGDHESCFYAMREVSEEAFHAESFITIIEKILSFYDLSLEDFRNHLGFKKEWYWDAFIFGHILIGKFLGHVDFYYFSRYPMNVVGRSYELLLSRESGLNQELQQIVKNHLADESRHLKMAKESGLIAINKKSGRFISHLASFVYIYYSLKQRQFGPPPKSLSSHNKKSLVGLLKLCGIDQSNADKAYQNYKSRIHQKELNPRLLHMKNFQLEENMKYIRKFNISSFFKNFLLKIYERNTRKYMSG